MDSQGMFDSLPMVGQDAQSSALAGLTPEQLQALVQASYANQQRADLDKQAASIAALRQPSGADYSKSPVGAALGGVGDVIRSGTAAYRDNQLQKQRADILAQQKGAGGSYVDSLVRLLRRQGIQSAFDAAAPADIGGVGAMPTMGMDLSQP